MGRGRSWVCGGRPISVDGRGRGAGVCSQFRKVSFLTLGIFGLGDAVLPKSACRCWG